MPRWQILAPHRVADDVISLFAWLGPEEIDDGLTAVLPSLRGEDCHQLLAVHSVMPNWMAQSVIASLKNG